MRGTRASPASTTARTPGTVRLDSATAVASTTRRPAPGRRAASCSAAGSRPCSGTTRASDAGQRGRGPPDLRHPGQEHQHVAVAVAQGQPHRPGHAGLDPLPARRRDVLRRRPGTSGSSRSAPAHRGPVRRRAAAASRSVATVAEVASSRRSGRSPSRASSSSASSRSASRCRSWHSSSSTQPTPASSGSAASRRSSSPEVTTSIRVRSLAAGLAAHRVPDGLADRLAEQRRHPGRGRPGGQPARLGDQHPTRPGRGRGQGQRDQRGLAGARRRDQHRGAVTRPACR